MENKDEILQILEGIRTGELTLEDEEGETEEYESDEDECEQKICERIERAERDPEKRKEVGRYLLNMGKHSGKDGASKIGLRYVGESITQLEMCDVTSYPVYFDLSDGYLLRAKYQAKLGTVTRASLEDAIQKLESMLQRITPTSAGIFYGAATTHLGKRLESLKELLEEYKER